MESGVVLIVCDCSTEGTVVHPDGIGLTWACPPVIAWPSHCLFFPSWFCARPSSCGLCLTSATLPPPPLRGRRRRQSTCRCCGLPPPAATMQNVLQELGLNVAAQSAADAVAVPPSGAQPANADVSNSAAATPASPPSVQLSGSDEPVPESVQQMMLDSFFSQEEGKERRAGQARAAAAAGFAPTPVAGGPIINTGMATVDGTCSSTPSPAESETVLVPAANQVGTQPRSGAVADDAGERAQGRRLRNRSGASGGSGIHRPRQSAAVEPAFEFSTLRPFTHYAKSTESFVSLWMLSVVALWPQAGASAKRRRLNAEGADCPGAGENSAEGTNVAEKTWMTRIRTACAFADFIGRTVCIHDGDERPSDAEIDRGVRKFFTCMTPFTKLTIIAFLKCRRAGYSIAGRAQTLTPVTLKDYTSGLSFLFAEAKLDGPLGVVPLVKDCPERNSPWQMKGVAELNNEKKVRADPGTFIGNPMATADVKNFRGAANKEARQCGEQSLSSAPVTPEIMAALHAELFRSHLSPPSPPAPHARPTPSAPSDPAPLSNGCMEAAPASSPPASQGKSLRVKAARLSGYSPPSVGQADMLTYVYYVVAFLTLARPVTINYMTFDDVTFPDLKLAENFEFFQRYVQWAQDLAGDTAGGGWWRCAGVFALANDGFSPSVVASLFLVANCFPLSGLGLLCPCAGTTPVSMSLVPLSHQCLLLSHRHKHHRFVNLRLRLTKTGTSTTDVMTVRLFSFFTQVSAKDERELGQMGWVHCRSEHLNFPQLFHALLLFACSAPGVGMDVNILLQQPLFPSLLVRSVSGAVRLFKSRSETEINTRFLADLTRIGQDLMNGERACRLYGFRRGGAQALLDATGLFEQVMRLGGWSASSGSFFRYVAAMNTRGTLRSTLRSFRQDEITQVVSQVTASFGMWTSGVVRDVCLRAIGGDGVIDHDAIAAIESDHVKKLCSLLCQCVLTLRFGTVAAYTSDEEK